MRKRGAWLAGMALLAAALAACGGGESPAPPLTMATLTCTQATLGVDPATNTGLAGDCDTLLAAKAKLVGTGSLNWSADTALTKWDGVTVSGTPERVTELDLASRELTGAVPAGLGNLRQLTTLTLNGNRLTGRIPSKLEQLAALTTVDISGNSLTGCAPSAWQAAPNQDLSGLPYCPEPLDADEYIDSPLIPGKTYRFQANQWGNPLILDIPEGRIFNWNVDNNDSSSGPVSILILEDTQSYSDIAFNWHTGEEFSRYFEAKVGAMTSTEEQNLNAIFDYIADSAWIGPLD